MKDNDHLGDRMKFYEMLAGGQRLMPMLPVLARMDGRSFHTFTRGMKRPYDERLSGVMADTALFLTKETNACMGYTQSDEISLLWFTDDPNSQIWFDGRVAKMIASLAALATLKFNKLLEERMPEFASRLPTFDARVWTVPNKDEAVNAFIWREQDATKNSISMAARSQYSDKEVFGKNGSEKQEMLFQKDINWNDYPVFFKRGVYTQRRRVMKPFSTDEISRLPEKHAARTNPDLMVMRSEWRVLELPVLTTITNRIEVLFNGAEPVVASKEK